MAVSLAIFDIDGTLLDGDCGLLFARFCARRGLLGAREFAAGVAWLARAAFGLIDVAAVEESKRVALRFQARIGEVATRALLEECFQQQIRPRARGVVLAELALHRERGEVVLVTANLRDFALRWGKELGVPEARCFGAEGVRVDGRITDRLVGPVPVGEERARFTTAIIAELGADKTTTTAFGDSAFDIPMLSSVGQPCAVHPSRKLRGMAQASGWRIID